MVLSESQLSVVITGIYVVTGRRKDAEMPKRGEEQREEAMREEKYADDANHYGNMQKSKSEAF